MEVPTSLLGLRTARQVGVSRLVFLDRESIGAARVESMAPEEAADLIVDYLIK